MLKNETFSDRLNQTIATCRLHFQRMKFAESRIKDIFPLDITTYKSLNNDQISYIDQLIYRFLKLQDTMGKKLFPLILEGLHEDIENMAFIDILHKLEKIGLITDTRQWLLLRETRNTVTHEYPFQLDLLIEGLNQLWEQLTVLSGIWEHTEKFVTQRF